MQIRMKRDMKLCDAELAEGDVIAEIELAKPLNLITVVDAVRNGFADGVVEVEPVGAPVPKAKK